MINVRSERPCQSESEVSARESVENVEVEEVAVVEEERIQEKSEKMVSKSEHHKTEEETDMTPLTTT